MKTKKNIFFFLLLLSNFLFAQKNEKLNQIDIDNAYIELYPKIITIQIGENWNDYKANSFTVEIYDSLGKKITNSINNKDLVFDWKVSDASSIILKPVINPGTHMSILNMKKPKGNREGLYFVKVEVYYRNFKKPIRPKILKADGIVNIRRDPHGLWDRAYELDKDWPQNRERKRIEIYPIDNDPDRTFKIVKGKEIVLTAVVSTSTYEFGVIDYSGRPHQTSYYGKVLNPKIEWGFLNKKIYGSSATDGEIKFISEKDGNKITIKGIKAGDIYVTATHKNQTTKRLIRVVDEN